MVFDKFLQGSRTSNNVKKDHITIDVNPEQTDDIETLEDPNNIVKLNSVLTKTQKRLDHIKLFSGKEQVIEMISKLDEDLQSFQSLFKKKMNNIQSSISDFKSEQPTIPILNLEDI